MVIKRLFLIVGSFLALSQFSAQADETGCDKLRIAGPPEYFPISYNQNGVLKGMGVDLALEIAKRAGITAEVEYKGNWSRVLRRFDSGEVDLLVSLYRNEEREKTMRFLPAYWAEKTIIVTPNRRPIDYQEWADLKAYKGVTVSDDSRGDLFDGFMRRELNMLYVHSRRVAFNMLLAGRVDYSVIGEYSTFTDAFRGDEPKLVRHPNPVREDKIHMALSKATSCFALAAKLDDILQGLVRDGEAARLYESHVSRWAQ